MATCGVKHIPGSQAEQECPVHGHRQALPKKSKSSASTVVVDQAQRISQAAYPRVGMSQAPVVHSKPVLYTTDGRKLENGTMWVYTDSEQAERIINRELSSDRVAWYLHSLDLTPEERKSMELAFSYVSPVEVDSQGEHILSPAQAEIRDAVESKFMPMLEWQSEAESDGFVMRYARIPGGFYSHNADGVLEIDPKYELVLSPGIEIASIGSRSDSWPVRTEFEGMPPWLQFDSWEGKFRMTREDDEVDETWKDMVSQVVSTIEDKYNVVTYDA